MTRDAVLLKLLNIAALLCGTAAFAMTGHAGDYGLSDVAVKWIALMSTLLGTASAWLSTSPLKGKTDDSKVRGTGAGLMGAIVVMALGGSMLVGCGDKKVVLPADVPLAINSTDAQLRAAADRAVKMLAASQDLLVEVIKAEKAIEPSMSAAVKAKARDVLHRVNAGIIAAAQTIKTAAHTAGDIRGAVDTALTEVQRLTDLAAAFRQPGGFGELAAKLFDYVKSIISGRGAPLALAGVRS